MRREKIFGLLILAMILVFQTSLMAQNKREFRGAWIQCVNGQYLGKSTQQIQSMLSKQLDELQKDGVNAIIFQVRAECDALYASEYEPWSRYLTGYRERRLHLIGIRCSGWWSSVITAVWKFMPGSIPSEQSTVLPHTIIFRLRALSRSILNFVSSMTI